jgi:Na+-translocating ferredoxin:NAD+ oxidoreductase subunit C
MKGLYTFRKGGVHPPGRKGLSSGKPIRNALLSSLFIVPLSQHLGKPAECTVSVDDEIREGMLIGKASGFISSSVHAPVPGTVKEIREVFLPNGVKSIAVVIEMAGEFDQLGKEIPREDWEKLSIEELFSRVSDNGVVGLGGATFPSHVKFSVPKGKQAEYFVLNGVECEPYLTADHRIMLERTDAVIEGLKIIKKMTSAQKLAVGIEINKVDAIDAMRAGAAKAGMALEVYPLKVKYPQGDEKQLLKAITGREVPSGGLPLDIGAIVANVGTVNALFEAIVYNKPLIERVVTVSGGAISDPQNLKVRVGTPVRALIEECGGFTKEPAKVVMGGPMMGFAIYDLDTPVIKGTSGILALTKNEVRDPGRTPCISCGRCISVCPMGLNPTSLFKAIDHGDYAQAMDSGLMDCKECGCCGFGCPAGIPLVQGMRLGKKMGRKKSA